MFMVCVNVLLLFTVELSFMVRYRRLIENSLSAKSLHPRVPGTEARS